MNIVLVLPNIYYESRPLEQECKEPLGILYLASVLRQDGHSVHIVDAGRYGLSVMQTFQIIKMLKPDLVGFSAVQRNYLVAIEIAKLIKSEFAHIHICFGGYFPTLSPGQLFNTSGVVDSVVIGEGEMTFREIVSSLDSGVKWNNINGVAYFDDGHVIISNPRKKIADLDDLPFPARDLLPDVLNSLGYASVFSSRGCYGNCSFCSQNAFEKMGLGPNWRGRSAKNVVDEIEILYHEYGVRTFKFNDDNIFGPGINGKNRVIDMCKEILNRNLHVHIMAYCRVNDITEDIAILMKNAGFERLLIGIESINNETLKRYGKNITSGLVKGAIRILNKTGISFVPGFMMFDPYTSVQDLKNNLEFLKSIDAYGVCISKNLKVHDATRIKDELAKNNKLVEMDSELGYHEYKVSNNIARIYMINKMFWVNFIDIINEKSTFIIMSLKNKVSFSNRQSWTNAIKELWNIQADFLNMSIDWVENSRDMGDIKNDISSIVSRILNERTILLNHVPENEHIHEKEYSVGFFNLNEKRLLFDIVSSLTFDIPNKNAYEYLLKKFDNKDVDQNDEYEQLYQIIISRIEPVQRIERECMALEDFTNEVLKILNDKNIETLPEKYVWR